MLFIGSHATRTCSGDSQRGIFISPRYQLMTGIIYREKRQFKRAIPACQGQKPRARHGQRKLATTHRFLCNLQHLHNDGYLYDLYTCPLRKYCRIFQYNLSHVKKTHPQKMRLFSFHHIYFRFNWSTIGQQNFKWKSLPISGGLILLVVRAKGLEPSHRRYQILSLARLPIPPRPHMLLSAPIYYHKESSLVNIIFHLRESIVR